MLSDLIAPGDGVEHSTCFDTAKEVISCIHSTGHY